MVVLLRERATGIRAEPDRLGRGFLAVRIHVRHQSSSHRVRLFGSKHRDAIAIPDTRTIEWTTGWTTDVGIVNLMGYSLIRLPRIAGMSFLNALYCINSHL